MVVKRTLAGVTDFSELFSIVRTDIRLLQMPRSVRTGPPASGTIAVFVLVPVTRANSTGLSFGKAPGTPRPRRSEIADTDSGAQASFRLSTTQLT